MTPALRTARGLALAAAAATICAVYLGITAAWWMPAISLYAAAFLAWCAHRSYAHHRRILTDHEHARRAARLEVELHTPCCEIGDHSDGKAHSWDCRRRTPGPDEELGTACCDMGFVSRGMTHDSTCPANTTRSNTA